MPVASHVLLTTWAMSGPWPDAFHMRTVTVQNQVSLTRGFSFRLQLYCGIAGRPMPVASHVLLISRDTIRVYSAEGVAVGDRTTVRKFPIPEEVPLLAAGAFSTAAGPGVVFLTQHLWHAVRLTMNFFKLYRMC